MSTGHKVVGLGACNVNQEALGCGKIMVKAALKK
jgi:hypothetical protein